MCFTFTNGIKGKRARRGELVNMTCEFKVILENHTDSFNRFDS